MLHRKKVLKSWSGKSENFTLKLQVTVFIVFKTLFYFIFSRLPDSAAKLYG